MPSASISGSTAASSSGSSSREVDAQALTERNVAFAGGPLRRDHRQHVAVGTYGDSVQHQQLSAAR